MRHRLLASTMTVFALLIYGNAAHCLEESEEGQDPPKWTLVQPVDSSTIAGPVNDLQMSGTHTPLGVSSYVTQVYAHGSSSLLGDGGGQCAPDGTWSADTNMNNPLQEGMYDAMVLPAGSSTYDDRHVFYVE